MTQTYPSNETEYHTVGSVKFYDPKKGYGFIVPDTGGADILLHANVLRNWGVGSVADRSRIEVMTIQVETGLQATKVLSIVPPCNVAALKATAPKMKELKAARVKWFCIQKGYGFANLFGQSDDVFIGRNTLQDFGFSSLEVGEAVALCVERNDQGQFASQVFPWDVGYPEDK